MTQERDHAHATSTTTASPDQDEDAPGRASRSALLRKPDHAVASGLVQRKARDANGVADGADSAVAAASSQSGSPLPEPLMRKFESSLGADLSGVRVHTGAESATANDAVGAKAYTMGNDIHFGAGNYDPSSSSGEHLLAHEVAHTVQQGGGAQRMQFKLAVSSPGDALEHEADRAADAMVSGAPATVSGAAAGIAREKKATKTDDTTAEWDAAKAKVLLGSFTSTRAAVEKSKKALYRCAGPGVDLIVSASKLAHTLKDNADAAREKFVNVMAMANGLAKSQNYLPDMLRNMIVGEAVDVILGPAKILTETPLGAAVYGAAKHYAEGIVEKAYKIVIPPVPEFAVPPVTTDNADKLVAALDLILEASVKLGKATRAHEALDPISASCASIGAELGGQGAPSKLDAIATIAAGTDQMKVACAESDKVCATALRNAVEVEHQARIRCVTALAVEKRMWSIWLESNTPPEDHAMSGVAGHPNVSIGAHLDFLGLTRRGKDGKREATPAVELQRWVGSKVVPAGTNPFMVRPVGYGPERPAIKPSVVADEYVVVDVAGGTHLEIAPATAPLNAKAEQDAIEPGTLVTVVDHLMPHGTVISEGRIAAATTGGGIAVASGSKVPVTATKDGRLVVDASKAIAGTPYGQYDLGPGKTPDTYFPVSHEIPGKPPTKYGYHRETFDLQATVGSREYFVLDGYHLENNLDAVVCKKD